MSLDQFSLPFYIKYIGIPLTIGTIGYAIYRIHSHIKERKLKNALRGKVVVITGASSGIGEALAHEYYECGCKVVLASRRIVELERVKKDLLNKQLTQSKEPFVLELDLEDLNQLEPFAQKVFDKYGQIDILINNGGITHRGSVLHTKLEVYKKIMYINYFGAIGLTKAVLSKMVQRKSGDIVFISSVQGLIAIPERSAYAAAKHALQAFGDSLRAEMHQHNINVCVISPGYVKTAVSLNALTGSGEKHGKMDKETSKGFTAEYVAKEILRAVVNKKNELIISQFFPKFAIYVRHRIPSLYFSLSARRAEKTG